MISNIVWNGRNLYVSAAIPIVCFGLFHKIKNLKLENKKNYDSSVLIAFFFYDNGILVVFTRQDGSRKLGEGYRTQGLVEQI